MSGYNQIWGRHLITLRELVSKSKPSYLDGGIDDRKNLGLNDITELLN